MRRTPANLLLLCLAASWAAGSAVGQGVRASQVVEPRTYVSLEPVPRGRDFEVAVVAKIRPGYHINAHEVSEGYLIPTVLEADLPPGFSLLDTFHPPGVLRSFEFSPSKLSVYEGSTTLRMKIRALLDAPLGPQKLLLTLRYQACTDRVCLPPAKLPVAAELEVGSADAPARPAHADIFQAGRHPKTQAPH
ncbi:MAG TPA: protein-disulfide reductase DsbD domain-containing protein [Candidatus Acidoferrales bacterium]|jgi:hypothetical protein|nr:protein-disulfide reductase DsbD domain-containing protein [Candidatus Acidoferrales bacterium]